MKNRGKDKDHYYFSDYMEIMNTGVIGVMSKFIHRFMDYPYKKRKLKIIEVGAGNGQHLALTSLDYEYYLETDIRDLMQISSKKISELASDRMQIDATYLSQIKDESFDLLISTCLIVHLEKPELALNNWLRVVKKGGELCIYVPCDPGFILRLVRFFSTRRKFIQMGYDHAYQHWTEHRNHFPLINTLIMRVFEGQTVRRSFFPFFLPSWNLNMFVIYRIKLQGVHEV